MNKGFFISVESIDGLGKSTQVEMLAKALTEAGEDVFLTKEPGDTKRGSAVGQKLREIIFYGEGTKSLHPGVADLLFLADHMQNAGDVAQAVAEGKIVISDRYADSQFAYAAAASKRCPDWALRLYHEHYGIVPDLTFLLRARGVKGDDNKEDIGWALRRAQARRGEEAGKQEGKGWNDVEQQRAIQDAYMAQLAGRSRTAVVNVGEATSCEELHDTILHIVKHRMFITGLAGGVKEYYSGLLSTSAVPQ